MNSDVLPSVNGIALLQVAVKLLKYDKSEYKRDSLPTINLFVTTPTDILATSGCNFCGIRFWTGLEWARFSSMILALISNFDFFGSHVSRKNPSTPNDNNKGVAVMAMVGQHLQINPIDSFKNDYSAIQQVSNDYYYSINSAIQQFREIRESRTSSSSPVNPEAWHSVFVP
jgi:hypothetical protein